jgi:hypothetical protein
MMGNQGLGLGQVQKCDWIKPVNGTPTLLFWTIISLIIKIYNMINCSVCYYKKQKLIWDFNLFISKLS